NRRDRNPCPAPYRTGRIPIGAGKSREIRPSTFLQGIDLSQAQADSPAAGIIAGQPQPNDTKARNARKETESEQAVWNKSALSILPKFLRGWAASACNRTEDGRRRSLAPMQSGQDSQWRSFRPASQSLRRSGQLRMFRVL